MPTVSNHDVLGTLSWGAGGNSRHFNRDPFGEPLGGRGDARDGINSLLFGGEAQHHHHHHHHDVGGAGAGACAPGVQAEHAYALGLNNAQQVAGAAARACAPAGSFVSQNGYYGYQQPHAAAATVQDEALLAQDADCSMDTGENNPCHVFGAHPSLGGGGFGGPWQAQSDPINRIPRKRNLSARGPGAGAGAGAGAAVLALTAPHEQLDASGERACKRLRPSPFDEHEQRTPDQGTTQAMMVHGYGVPRSTPSIAEQSHSPAQMYDLPTQQLPGSTSQLVDMTPRPRCLMGHFI
ncbi:DNA helicase MCM9 [Frankliniella fusca]|uniref:DNA helicase MCM9 n=1 Tax=Frankliniella fusca TaxID=407009 RepID=A0AAE1HZL0_9NEOP|nr:DNA helicase MCM9 [Frankliniella fusca]